jgi:hypothetical protein
VPKFLLLLRSDEQGWAQYSPEELQAAMQRYYTWSAELRGKGQLHHADELKSGGKTVRAHDGQMVIDGPYTETKESVGGYYLIEASDLDEAAQIAIGCPVLLHNGFVEVREVNE